MASGEAHHKNFNLKSKSTTGNKLIEYVKINEAKQDSNKLLIISKISASFIAIHKAITMQRKPMEKHIF